MPNTLIQLTPPVPVVDEPPLQISPPEAELIVRQASGLDDLLKREDLLERYLTAAGQYLGAGRAHRESFRIILEQLRHVVAKIPEISARLWETGNSGKPFLIPLGLKSYGRNVNSERWTVFLASWRQRLITEASPILGIGQVARREAQFSAYVRDLENQIARMREITKKSPDKKTSVDLLSAFYRTLKNDPKLIACSAYLLLNALESRNLSPHLHGDADLILATIHQLINNTASLIAPLHEHSFLTSFVRDRIPKLQTIMADPVLFPVATRTAKTGNEVPVGGGDSIVYLFRPASRRLHGIWKGITVGDCAGGDPRWGAHNATPERWGTIAIANSELHFIEQINGSPLKPSQREFVGYVHAVPFRHRDSKDVYGSLEFMSPVITKRALRVDEHGFRKVISTFDLWLEKAAPLRNPEWKGYVIGQSNAMNHDGVLDHVRRRPQFLLGEKFDAKGFEHLDPLIPALIACSHRRGASRVYGGNMIFDGSVPNSRDLTVLHEKISASESALDSYEATLKLLDHPDIAVGWWAALSLLRSQDPGRRSINLAIERFATVSSIGIRRIADPVEEFIERKYLEWRQMPPQNPPTSELWTETAFEMSQWYLRQNQERIQTVDLPHYRTLSLAEREKLSSRIVTLLSLAIRQGKTMAVRGASAIALGRMHRKDAADVKLICWAARARRTYRRRIVDGRLQLDAVVALGEMAWDHPLVSDTLARLLRQTAPDAQPLKKQVLESALKIRPSQPSFLNAIRWSLQHGPLEIRQLTLKVAQKLRYLTAEESEKLKYRGDVADPATQPFEKIEAINRFFDVLDRDDPRDVAFLEECLENESATEIREPLTQYLIRLGVVNVWTILAATKRPLEAQQAFLRTAKLRKVSVFKITAAIQQACRLERSPQVQAMGERLRSELLKGRRPFSPLGFSLARSIGIETILALGFCFFLFLEAAVTFTFFYHSYYQVESINRGHDQAIQKLRNTVDRLEQGTSTGLKARLPAPWNTSERKNFASDREFKWVTELDAKLALLPQLRGEAKAAAAFQAKQLIHRMELEVFRKLAEGNKEESRIVLLYITLNIVATVIGVLLSAAAIWMVRRAIRRRLAAERAIRTSEERFRLCIAAIKDHAIFMLNGDGQIVTWNQAAESMTGFTGNEITGRNLTLLFSRQKVKAGQVAQELRQCRKMGWFHGESPIARRDGSFFLGQLTLTALKDEKGLTHSIVAVIRKVTEQGGRRGNSVSLPVPKRSVA